MYYYKPITLFYRSCCGCCRGCHRGENPCAVAREYPPILRGPKHNGMSIAHTPMPYSEAHAYSQIGLSDTPKVRDARNAQRPEPHRNMPQVVFREP